MTEPKEKWGNGDIGLVNCKCRERQNVISVFMALELIGSKKEAFINEIRSLKKKEAVKIRLMAWHCLKGCIPPATFS